MKAVTFAGKGSFRLSRIARPGLTEGRDALIRVTLASICGSDLHIFHGETPIQPGAPIGHEFVGTVEAIGQDVRRFRTGDRVVAAFFVACGDCFLCRRGWYAQCEEKGTFGHGEYFGGLGGGQAEYVLVPRADLTLERIPDSVTDEQAIFVGDALATGYFGAERAEIRPGDTVAVIGAGPVGLCAIMAANLFGPARVFAVDSISERLALAAQLGAIPVDLNEVHPVQFLKSQTEDHGVDSSIECVGAVSAVETAVNCLRGGGTCSMVGVPSVIEWPFPLLTAWMTDLTFRVGWCNVHSYMRPLLDLIAAGKLHPEQIISHRMSLDQVLEAYLLFESRQAIKIVLKP